MTTDRELKNSIFAAKAAAEGAQQPQRNNNNPKDDLGFDLEIKAAPIPSMGLVYPVGHPLFNAQVVDIKQMTTKEQDILTNRTLVKSGRVITELLKSSILDKSIDVTDLLSGDRNAIMFSIRIHGYQKEYRPKVNCPKCGKEQRLDVDLEQLPLKTLDLTKVNQVAEGANEFSFLLPSTKKNVVFKFLTGKDEERILLDLETKRKKGILQENLVTTRLISSIISIEGHANRDLIAKFCTNMPAKDSLALTKHIDATEPGIDMTKEFVCLNTKDDCEFAGKIDIPMTSEFFSPSDEE